MRERSNRPGRKYAAIPNEAMRDQRLSIEARGLLALLMTYSDDWHFQRDHLMQLCGMGKDRFGKVMGELIEFGYVEMVFTRDEKGHLLGKTWVIKDDGTDVREMPTSDSTDVRKTRRPVNPTSGESAPIRIPTGKNTNREEDLFGSIEPQSLSRVKVEDQDRALEFWEAYPRCKRKLDRADVLITFRKIVAGKHPKQPKTDAETIIAAVKRFAMSGDDPEFMPNPVVWLNKGRWEGYPPAPVNAPVQRWVPGGVVR